MKINKTIPAGLDKKYILSTLLMGFCLFLLTGINFIVYPQNNNFINFSLVNSTNSNDEESPAPVEEKSTAKTGISIQEEYIHDVQNFKEPACPESLIKHKIPAAEKLQVVHFELISPPPKA